MQRQHQQYQQELLLATWALIYVAVGLTLYVAIEGYGRLQTGMRADEQMVFIIEMMLLVVVWSLAFYLTYLNFRLDYEIRTGQRPSFTEAWSFGLSRKMMGRRLEQQRELLMVDPDRPFDAPHLSTGQIRSLGDALRRGGFRPIAVPPREPLLNALYVAGDGRLQSTLGIYVADEPVRGLEEVLPVVLLAFRWSNVLLVVPDDPTPTLRRLATLFDLKLWRLEDIEAHIDAFDPHRLR